MNQIVYGGVRMYYHVSSVIQLNTDLSDAGVSWHLNGKPTFLLNDFRKKVDKSVKSARYVTGEVI